LANQATVRAQHTDNLFPLRRTNQLLSSSKPSASSLRIFFFPRLPCSSVD